MASSLIPWPHTFLARVQQLEHAGRGGALVVGEAWRAVEPVVAESARKHVHEVLRPSS